MNVEDQVRAAITRQADRYEVPLPDIDGFAAGGMRRRRRQRRRNAVAALAACAVLGIVASGFVAGRNLWDSRGAGPAGQPPSPTQEATASSSDDRVGFVGPPPPGTPPTGAATGEVVAKAETYTGGTYVYADGRIINSWINHRRSDRFRGYVLRQLTPSGVEAMRSFLVDRTSGLTPVSGEDEGVFVRDGGRLMRVRDFSGCEAHVRTSANSFNEFLCPGFTDPDWLPASAWEDPAFRPFVPHSYDVCGPLSPAGILPTEAADLLFGPESTPGRPFDPEELCRRLPNSVARELADVMDQAGPTWVRQEGDLNLHYEGHDAGLGFRAVLPHGASYCDCG